VRAAFRWYWFARMQGMSRIGAIRWVREFLP
jgi:hypothetical protein